MKLTPYLVTQLATRWCVRLLRRPSREHGFILMYHRIAEPAVDPWNICVSPEHFAGHMQALCEMADVLPLDDLPYKLRSGRSSRPVAAVTFDDAYLDNLTTAKPVLDALNIPATVFVPTGWIDDPRPMWWDRLAHLLLAAARLPESLELREQGRDFSWREPGINGSGKAGRRCRARLHRTFWSGMRELANDDSRHAVLDALADALGMDEEPVSEARPLTHEEIRTLTADGRVRIGSHAVTHPTLPSLRREQKAWEIEHSAEQCRQLSGERPSIFAYPYGDLDAESVELVRQAGYSLACSTREDLVWEGDDPHLLPRIAVGDWSPGEFRKRLSWYWLA
jgi:peptidoglycan/xylan/chitin deacetylase (PgdA/CDA1 family)